MSSMDVKRVRVEYELADGTVKHFECTDVVDFKLDAKQEPRETTWEQAMPTWRTFEPGPLLELSLRVTAKAAERSAP
jgi:hypothetical protein